MNIYQPIKDFGKTLLVGGLVIVLGGCSKTVNVQYKTTQIFRDLDKDGKPEQIYLVETGWGGFGTGPIYELRMRKGIGEGMFGNEELLQKFRDRPEEIKVEDITGDEIPDLVYLLNLDYSDFTDFLDGMPTYELRMREGIGDGNFSESRVVQKYKGKPAGLY